MKSIFAAIGLATVVTVTFFMLLTTQSSPPTEQVYAFDIPVQYTGCIEYQLQDGETFGNMKIHQPMAFIAPSSGRATMHTFYIEVSRCWF